MRLHVVPLSDARVGDCSAPRFLLVLDEVEAVQSTTTEMESCRVALDGCVGTLVFGEHVEVV